MTIGIAIAVLLAIVAIVGDNVSTVSMWSPPKPQEAKVGWVEGTLRDWRALWK